MCVCVHTYCICVHTVDGASEDVFLPCITSYMLLFTASETATSKKIKRRKVNPFMRQAENEREKRVGVENQPEIDRAKVGVLIQCVCGPLRELSLLTNKEEVDENKAEVA